MTIRIDDLNDNPPQFVAGTLGEFRSVTEMEDIFSTIGTIEAYDIDGSGNNDITYKLRFLFWFFFLICMYIILKIFRPLGNLTKNGLVSINSTTGLLKVAGLIQCDVPQIYNLEYEVTVTDSLHETKGKVWIAKVLKIFWYKEIHYRSISR